jgi:hypothetical protein
MLYIAACDNQKEGNVNVPTFKYTWPIYQDWDVYQEKDRNMNNYEPPNGPSIGNRYLDLPLDPENNFYPYNWYMANDPFDYAPIDAWKNMPRRTWGNGVYDKYGYYLPVNI